MDIKGTQLNTQQEQIIALKQYILNAPASNAEHQQALGWLHGIMQGYSEQIISMKQELENLKQHERANKTAKNNREVQSED